MPGSKVKLADFGLAVECEKNHKEYFGEWTCTEGDKKRDFTRVCVLTASGVVTVCVSGVVTVCQ